MKEYNDAVYVEHEGATYCWNYQRELIYKIESQPIAFDELTCDVALKILQALGKKLKNSGMY